MSALCMIKVYRKHNGAMRNYILMLIAFVVIVVSSLVLFSALSYELPELYENVEALSDNEVNHDKLKEMLAQAIWDTRLVYDPNTQTTDVYCVTDGIFVCPISNP